jgi:hypothetical protein
VESNQKQANKSFVPTLGSISAQFGALSSAKALSGSFANQAQ